MILTSVREIPSSRNKSTFPPLFGLDTGPLVLLLLFSTLLVGEGEVVAVDVDVVGVVTAGGVGLLAIKVLLLLLVRIAALLVLVLPVPLSSAGEGTIGLRDPTVAAVVVGNGGRVAVGKGGGLNSSTSLSLERWRELLSREVDSVRM